MKYRIRYRVRKILETQFQVKLESIKLECVSRMAFKRKFRYEMIENNRMYF